jgi:hypothetical protein
MVRRRVRLARNVCLLAGVAVGAALLLVERPAAAVAPQTRRIVAIGDIHGALEPFAAILQRAGLIDGNRQWSGGNAVLVQTGDVFDRGDGVR